MSSDTVLVLQHQDDAPSGNLQEWLDENGVEYQVVDATGTLPAPDLFRAVVCLGSRESVFDDSVGWIGAERTFLQSVSDAGTPVFGICFGAQQLAMISGGHVARMERPERGWITVDGDETVDGRWFAWHQDEITPGADSVVLARSDRAVQAFRTGRHLGVQFHPEITPPLVTDWMNQSRRADALAASGTSPNDLLEETKAVAADARAAAFELYSTVLRHTLPNREIG